MVSQRGVFEQTKKRFGDIDIVCNNAGVGDEISWRKMIDINLVSCVYVCERENLQHACVCECAACMWCVYVCV